MNKKQRKKKKALQIKNKKLIKEYPFILPRNVWTDKIPKDYDYTYIDWGCAPGWDKAFGDMYLKELGDAVKKSKLKEFRILQIKEKFGEYRLYCNFATKEIHDIINKYETISRRVCINCGALDVPMLNTGWISPYCYDCFKKAEKKRETYRKKYVKDDLKSTVKTEDDYKKLYKEAICEEPDEDGTYKIPNSYTMREFSKEETKDVTYDISETVRLIRYKNNRR